MESQGAASLTLFKEQHSRKNAAGHTKYFHLCRADENCFKCLPCIGPWFFSGQFRLFPPPPTFSALAFYKNTENCLSCSRRNFWHFVKLINNICIPKIHYISIYLYNELFKTKHNILWAATSIEFYRLSWYANIFFEFAQFISRKRQFSLVFSPQQRKI